mgnify:CR=1 FL=1
MESSPLVRVWPRDGQDANSRSQRDEAVDLASTSPVRRAVRRTRQWLLGQQQADGHWCAELQGDTILESETILLWAFLGEEDSPRAQRAANYLVEQQLPEGGWAMYPGGAMEISGSVKAYFALKLTGHDPSSEYMQRARCAILARGGADAVNSFTRFYLALLGQISYEQCPAVPPEAVLLPTWFPVNLYAVSSWSRTIIVPLSLVWAFHPVRKLSPEKSIRELFRKSPDQWPELRCPGLPGGTGLLSWDRLFRTCDRLLKWCQRHNFHPLRARAIEAAKRWMLQRFQGSDGLGAIYPPIVWSWIALRCLGYADDSPEVQECRKQLDALTIDDPDSDTCHLQPCKSPVWDTAITVRALAASGLRADNRAMDRATGWLLDQEIRKPGDWSATVAGQGGAWCFEYANDYYPDCDDTAMVLMALRSGFEPAGAAGDLLPPELRLVMDATASPDEARRQVATVHRTAHALQRGQDWLWAMQNDDGGWGAFDRNNDRQFLCYVPFADHNAMIDPSTPDLTARVLEALGQFGRRVGDPRVDRGVAYLRRHQEADGSWYGRWGVNYIYGTWQTLVGLAAVGVPKDDSMVQAGAQWLITHQQASGAWGETADSYEDPRLCGQGPPTASQTAWAVMGLMAAGYGDHPAVARGIRYLVQNQCSDGTWDEPEFTGTGFPRVFYLRYHYYPIYFPLMALAHWLAHPASDAIREERPRPAKRKDGQTSHLHLVKPA